MAKRHGLIEAASSWADAVPYFQSYPWQNATASLKLLYAVSLKISGALLSVAKRHGLIEARNDPAGPAYTTQSLSVAKRHGLIEASRFHDRIINFVLLSVAKRHGLIEACRDGR